MKRLPFVTAAERAAAAAATGEHLAQGGLLVYPTETVYGFGSALERRALERLAAVKRRGTFRPFLVLAAHAGQLEGLVWTAAARRLAAAFWPGPLTLVLAARGGVAPQLLGEGNGVAVRVSPHPGVRTILAAIAAPITSTSANLPGEPPADSADAAAAAAGALDPDGNWLVLDGGTLPASQPSTIVRCIGDGMEVVREGAIPRARLRDVVEEIDGGK